MPTTPELLDHLSSRVTFVAGKGGVGKTTTAAALALALADRGRTTHLVSTDPAHSLGDVLMTPLPPGGEPMRSPCHPGLTVEEIDSRCRVALWRERVWEPLSELVDLGTYLDREDIESFLRIALPGVDEFMGALRLVEIDAGEADRVVIDTAPTGHTLRLLDSSRLLEGWAEALDAMAAKAGAVQERLLRRRIRLQGEAVIEELRDQVARLEHRVAPNADFLIVSRGDPVVRNETARLAASLRARGLRVAAEVRIAAPGPSPPAGIADGRAFGPGPQRGRLDEARLPDGPPVLEVPWNEGLRGCSGLRAWGTTSPAREGPRLPYPRPSDAPEHTGSELPQAPRAAALSEIFTKEVLFFTGKGGVGKSTCAAACALALARTRSTLLLGTDPADSLQDVLPDLESEAESSGSLTGRLRIRQVDAVQEFATFQTRYRDAIRSLFERMGLDQSARLDRRVLESLLRVAPPGLDEIFALHAILEERQSVESLVVDTAPTGHFLRLLELPETALQWTHAVLRALLKYRALVHLDEPAQELLRFARDLRALLDLLRDPRRAGVVIVTLDEPVVVEETRRLRQAIERGGLPLAAILWNQHLSTAVPHVPEGAAASEETPKVRAPRIEPAPVGPVALRSFFSQWSVLE